MKNNEKHKKLRHFIFFDVLYDANRRSQIDDNFWTKHAIWIGQITMKQQNLLFHSKIIYHEKLLLPCRRMQPQGLLFRSFLSFFPATRLFHILLDIRFRPNQVIMVIVTSNLTNTHTQTVMGQRSRLGHSGYKCDFFFTENAISPTLYGHVTHAYASARYPLQKLWV